jgi:hypothetical protein
VMLASSMKPSSAGEQPYTSQNRGL